MGVFEFVLLIVLITTVGKVLVARGNRRSETVLPPAPDTEHLEELMAEMNGRLARLEEERDFYKALLDPPDTPHRRSDRSVDTVRRPDAEHP